MLKNEKGITLIALVVTIVVLLILAGVTISLLLDENGIIAKSKDARTETRVSQIEDEVGMWKQHNFINKESNQAQESADTMLASLISRKLLTEDEIDREQELITIKKKDGTVIKEISYSSVTINISKTPATEKSGAVVLRATVTGTIIPNIDMSNGNEEFNNWMNSLSEEEKKEIIRQMLPKSVNKVYNATEYDTLEKAIVKLNEEQEIPETINTEEKLWEVLKELNKFDLFIGQYCIDQLCYNKDTKMIEGYTVTNPANATSNEYIATENGTYTFKIQDIVTGKTYTKKVEVTNVDTSLPSLTVVGEKDKYSSVLITLKVATADKYTKFEKAYIMYNNEKIEITSIISNDDKGISYISTVKIAILLKNKKIITSREVLDNTDQTIILVKDNKEYTGTINMGEVGEA